MISSRVIPLFFVFLFVFSAVLQPLSIAEDASSEADTLYEEGHRFLQHSDSEQDSATGLALIIAAASAGSAKAMVEVGTMYTAGLGNLLSEDYVEGSEAELAFSWYVKGAEAGAVDEAGEALSSDAFSYFLGSDDGSIQEDDAVALQYFQQAAEYGNPDAINMMVAFYTYGFGVEQDADKALELGSRLAEQGNAEALFVMEENAYAYYAGTKDGIEINFTTAFKYYAKLAEYGNERAMYNIGLLYEYGLGVSADHDKAIEWVTKALDAGYAPAEDLLSQLSKNT